MYKYSIACYKKTSSLDFSLSKCLCSGWMTSTLPNLIVLWLKPQCPQLVIQFWFQHHPSLVSRWTSSRLRSANCKTNLTPWCFSLHQICLLSTVPPVLAHSGYCTLAVFLSVWNIQCGAWGSEDMMTSHIKTRAALPRDLSCWGKQSLVLSFKIMF